MVPHLRLSAKYKSQGSIKFPTPNLRVGTIKRIILGISLCAITFHMVLKKATKSAKDVETIQSKLITQVIRSPNSRYDTQ